MYFQCFCCVQQLFELRALPQPQYLAMAARPFPRPGDYIQARPPPTRVEVKGYSAPPSIGGNYVGRVTAGAYVGPIIAVEHSEQFVTVLVDGWWINIWSANPHPIRGNSRRSTYGVDFAYVITQDEALSWERRGWRFRRSDGQAAQPASAAGSVYSC